MVVKGELPNDNEMPPAIQAYIKAHTYLSWDDGWFWKKLRYALPHKGKPAGMTILPRFLRRNPRLPANDRFQLIHTENGSFNNSTISLQQNSDCMINNEESSVGFSNIMGSNNLRHNSVSPMNTT